MKRTLIVLTGVALLVSAVAMGQPAKLSDGKGQVILSWDEFVKITGYDPARKGGQVLTVAWEDLEQLLGVDRIKDVKRGTTVDLPWKDFKALLEWSVKRKEKKDEVPPPTDFIVDSSQYEGKLSADGAEFVLKLKLNVLREKGWKRIPILPGTVAVTKAALPDAVFLNSTRKAYELLTEKSGVIDLTISFSVSVTTRGGMNHVSFQRLLPASSVVDLVADRDDVDVKVAGAQSMTSKVVAAKKRFVAAIPSGVAVAASWQRALPKVEPAPTKLYAQTSTLAAVAEELLVCDEIVRFNILHTGVRALTLTVPKTVNVLTVVGSNVQDWRVDDRGKLQVVLRAETIGSYTLRIAYETPAGDAVVIPVIQPDGVQRERGYIAVIAVSNVEIAAGKVVGATAIDVRRLPGEIVAMTNQPILLAFRYVGGAFQVPLTIKKHGEVGLLVTIADSALFTSMQLADGRRMTKVIYSVRNNRNQFLRLKMPAGADIWSVSVSGKAAAPAKDEKGNVLIPLVRSASGSRQLASFPVEIVYVEAPAKAVPAAGRLHVDLPTVDAPVMHVMFNYYLPSKGKYGVTGGFFATARSAFSGPLRVVKQFASLAAGPGAKAVAIDAAKQTRQMQKQFRARRDAEVRGAGGRPIHVRLPINGRHYRLEKILALPGDKLYFEVQYSGWRVAR